jgi:hypothetical protein
VEEDSFKKFYQTLIGLTVDGEARGQVPEKPEVSTSFFLNKGGAASVTVNYAPYDRDFYAVFIGGKCDFAITRLKLDAMLAKLARLIAGETIAD